jgi:hypothetical protein
LAKNWLFLLNLLLVFAKKTITLAFKKNANFFAENWLKSQKIGENHRKLAKIAENWRKSQKIGENRRKLAKIAENWRKSQKIGENRRKNVIITSTPGRTGSGVRNAKKLFFPSQIVRPYQLTVAPKSS